MIRSVLKYIIGALILGLLITFYFVGRNETSQTNRPIKDLLGKIDWKEQNLSSFPVQKNDWQPQIGSAIYVLMDAETSLVLVEKESDREVPVASTTKIMTALIVIENLGLGDTITVPREATKVVGSKIQLRTDERIKTSELLAGLLMESGNDVAHTLAYAVGQKNGKQNYEEAVVYFMDLMNQKAKDLNLLDTKYVDPAGLDAESQSTASDLVHLANYAMKNEIFRKIVCQTEKDVYNIDQTIQHHLKNSNRLLHADDIYFEYAIGVKTGFTPEAGHCLIAAAEKNGHTLISVVLNTHEFSVTASAEESRRLLRWGFDNFEWF